MILAGAQLSADGQPVPSLNLTRQCDPSQNGLLREAPQRQSE
jgi:hypothetical protein